MPEIRETIVLRVIPEPDPNTKTVVEYNGPGTTLIQGYETHIALVCGKCQAILAAGIEKSQIQDAVLRCKACGSFNDT